jgi:hypothetical protein
MFKKIKPQVAHHSDGYVVRITGRNSVQYICDKVIAEIYVDFAPESSELTLETLKVEKTGVLVMPDGEERNLIIDRIKAGLVCLVDKFVK